MFLYNIVYLRAHSSPGWRPRVVSPSSPPPHFQLPASSRSFESESGKQGLVSVVVGAHVAAELCAWEAEVAHVEVREALNEVLLHTPSGGYNDLNHAYGGRENSTTELRAQGVAANTGTPQIQNKAWALRMPQWPLPKRGKNNEQ